jgi:hypothetical protein
MEKIEDRYYVELPASELAFISSLDNLVMAIQLYAEGYENCNGFAGAIPEGISFCDSRNAIQGRLGKPSASGGGKFVPFYGNAPAWDRFDRSGYSLHIQYARGEESVDLVTIMVPDFVPR